MNEEGKQPQQMPHQIDEGRYKKLFGLEIYLTPVFVISSITIIVYPRLTYLSRASDTTFQKCPSLAYHKP